MKELFDELEKTRVKEKFKIDLDTYAEKMIFLERISEDNVYETFLKRFEQVREYLSTIKDAEANNNRSKYQPYSSLMYYFREWKKECESVSSNNEKNKTRAVTATKNFVYAAYNYICFLVFEASSNNESKTIIAFEACPKDQKAIDSRTEIRKIKKIARVAGINSLLVFATNINTFKYACLSYEFDYLHIACHGQTNGDLLFVGNNGSSNFLTFKTFENFFANGLLSLRPKTVVTSCYLNSCYSDAFVCSIHNSKVIGSLFLNKIGHIGSNYDDLAIESAENIYDKHFNYSKTIKDSFDDTKSMLHSSMSPYRIAYADDMTLY